MSGNSKRPKAHTPRGFHDVPRADVLAALGELYANLVQQPGIYYAEVMHDNGCPSTETHSLSDCTCETVNVRTGGRLQ